MKHNWLNNDTTGEDIYSLIEELYPICRSITGDGLRETLRIINKYIPLEVREVPTGTEVFDWKIPKEWNIRDAWIKNSEGEKIIDFQESNLHVLNYSTPIEKNISFNELKEHLYTLAEQPDLIPYRTSYYQEKWGFCLSHNQYLEMSEEDGSFDIYIDSELKDGALSYGELYSGGTEEEEIIITCHACHPSLCNDNLSGISVAVHLAKFLAKTETRYSYRFLFIPGTIGSITWLSQNEGNTKKIKYGLVLSCVGDSGHITYKKSRRGDALIDQIVSKVLVDTHENHELRDFTPYGYDERQFCSPAFNLPVGCFMRTPFGEFKEYHTSADNLDLVKQEALLDSFQTIKEIINVIEHNDSYLNTNPKCEPNLGKRGLYKLTGGNEHSEINQMAILWVLNLSDGNHSLLDISVRSSIDFKTIRQAADALLKVKLLKSVNSHE